MRRGKIAGVSGAGQAARGGEWRKRRNAEKRDWNFAPVGDFERHLRDLSREGAVVESALGRAHLKGKLCERRD